MGRSLTPIAAAVNDDTLYATTDTAINAGDLVVYSEAGLATTSISTSTITVRGPKLLSTVAPAITVANASGYEAIATDTLTNGNIAVIFNDGANTGRISWCVLNPDGTIAVAKVQLEFSQAVSMDVVALSGGGFALAWMSNNGTSIAVIQNNGTVTLAATQVSATTTSNGSTVRLCRGMTDGTGFIVCWSETGVTSLRLYNATGALQTSTTTSGPGPTAANVYGYGHRFALLRHPSDGNIYISYANADTTTGSEVTRVRVEKLNPQTLASLGTNATGFAEPFAVMSETFAGFAIVPKGTGVLVFARMRKTNNNSNYAGLYVLHYASDLSSDTRASVLGDSYYVSTTYAYGKSGSLRSRTNPTTGNSVVAYFDSAAVAVLEIDQTSKVAFERHAANADFTNPNISIALTSTGCLVFSPDSSASNQAVSLRTFSTASEVVTATGAYSALGVTGGSSSGSTSSSLSEAPLNRYVFGGLASSSNSTLMRLAHHRLAADLPSGGYAVACSSYGGGNTTYQPNASTNTNALAVFDATAKGLFVVHLLPEYGVFTAPSSRTPGECYNLQRMRDSLVLIALRSDRSTSALRNIYTNIIDPTTWAIGTETLMISDSTTMGYFDSQVLPGNRLHIAGSVYQSNSNASIKETIQTLEANLTWTVVLSPVTDGSISYYSYTSGVSVAQNRDRIAACIGQNGSQNSAQFGFCIRNISTGANISQTMNAPSNWSANTLVYVRLIPHGPTGFRYIFSNGNNSSIYIGILGDTANSSFGSGPASNGSIYMIYATKGDWYPAMLIRNNGDYSYRAYSMTAAGDTQLGTAAPVVSNDVLSYWKLQKDRTAIISSGPASSYQRAVSLGSPPAVVGVAKAAATAGSVVSVARTGAYRINSSHSAFSFNNKRDVPPGAKGTVTGSTAILDSSKTNIS